MSTTAETDKEAKVAHDLNVTVVICASIAAIAIIVRLIPFTPGVGTNATVPAFETRKEPLRQLERLTSFLRSKHTSKLPLRP